MKGSKNYEDLEQTLGDAKLKVSDWFDANELDESLNMSKTEKIVFSLRELPKRNSYSS